MSTINLQTMRDILLDCLINMSIPFVTYKRQVRSMMVLKNVTRNSLAAVVLCAVLTGCVTTPKGWRKKTPLVEATSSKSVDDVIRCVSETWQSQGASPNYLPRTNGGTLTLILPGVFGPSGQVGWMLDVDKADQGSHVRFYGMKSIWSKANAKTNDEVRACL